MLTNRSAPPGAVVPTLIYDDVPAAVEWLCATFGFQLRVRAGTSHAQLLVGTGAVILGASRKGAGFATARTKPNSAHRYQAS